MKKTLAVILTAAMLALTLASCGGSFNYDKVSLVEDGYVTLGDYKNVDVDVAELEKKEVSDAEVYENAIAHLDHGHTDIETVERAAEEFDLVNIAFVGTIDGVEFEGGTSDDTDLVIGAGNFIPGFEDGIIGMNIGDTRDVTVTFPEDYGKEELNGKEAVFAITLNTVYDKAVFDDVRAELEEVDTAALDNAVWEAVVKTVTVNKYPESYVNKLAKDQYKYYEYMYRSMGMMQDLSDLGVTMESCKEAARNQVDSEFAVYAIAEAEGITATDDELQAKVDEYVEMYVGYGYTEAEAKSMFSKDSVKVEVLQEKIIALVVENLKATAPVEE